MEISDLTMNVRDKEILLRNAKVGDAQMLIHYLKVTCGETRFLAKEPEEVGMTVKQEEDFIKKCNESDRDLMILAFMDGEYIGNCSLSGNGSLRYRHRATIGIALYQKYTGMGIGHAMLEAMIKIAKDKGYEQLELEVVADNERAVRLYESLGFQIYGRFPDNMKYKDGTYADAYWMMKKL